MTPDPEVQAGIYELYQFPPPPERGDECPYGGQEEDDIHPCREWEKCPVYVAGKCPFSMRAEAAP